MNLRDLASVFLRHWILLIGCTVAGAALGLSLGFGAKTSYTAIARVAVMGVTVTTPEQASQMVSAIRAEMNLYHSLTFSDPVAERAARRIGGGAKPSEVSSAVSASTSDQILILTVVRPDEASAKSFVDAISTELAAEITSLQPQVIKAEALDVPTKVTEDAVSRKTLTAAGGVLGLLLAVVIVGVRMAFKPEVGGGSGLRTSSDIVLRARPEETTFHQLAVLLVSDPDGELILVGSGDKVNLGPWASGLTEALGARVGAVTVSASGVGREALEAARRGAVAALFVDSRDSLDAVKEMALLLNKAGANVAASIVVSDARA